MKKLYTLVLIILLLPTLSSPYVNSKHEGRNTVELRVPAVTRSDGKMRGITSSLSVTVEPGSGHIYMETWPLSEVDMQASARLSVQTAAQTLDINSGEYNYYISVSSNSPMIGGPSAGAAMTVGIIAAIENITINKDVMMTGMINPDGSIGPVGGIIHKVNASKRYGVSKFLVPEGQAEYTDFRTEETINVRDHADPWGIEVVEVSDIYDVVKHYTGYEISRPDAENVEINSEFLSPYGESDIEETERMLVDAQRLAEEVNFPEWGQKNLKTSLESGKQALMDSKRAYNNSKYYTSLSKSFQARINLNYVKNYLDIYRRDREISSVVKEEIQSTNSSLKQIKAQIKGKEDFNSIEELQGYAAAQNRIGTTEELLEQAKNSLEVGELANSIRSYSRAQERLKTAKFWYQLSKDLDRNNQKTLNQGEIRFQAQNFIHSARLLKIYLENLAGMQQETPMLDRARNNLENERYAAALYNAMEARSTLEAMIVSMGSDQETLNSRINQAENSAKIAIGKLQEKGIQPILGLSYYEFAQSYKKSDKTTALVYLKQARLSSTAFFFQEGSGNVTLNEISRPDSDQSRDLYLSQENIFVASIALSVLIAGLIGYIVGRKNI